MNSASQRRAVRPITGGAVRSAAGQFVSAAAGALTTLVLARILGPAAAGRYAVAMSLVVGLQTLGSLSLQVGIGYFVGSGTWTPRRALFETQMVALVLGALAMLVALAIRLLVPAAFHGVGLGLTLLAAASVPFALSWMFTAGVALATDHYELYAFSAALQNGIGLIAIIALGAAFRVPGALAGLTLSHIIASIWSLAWSNLSLPHSGSSEPNQLRKALSFALTSHASNALTFLTYRLDIFILNGVAAARQVGQYSIAVAVTQAVWLLPGALSSVVMPRIAQVSADQVDVDDAYQEMIERKGVRHAAVLALLSGLCLAGVLVILVQALLGPAFHDSIVLGLILLPGSVLLAVTAALSSVMAGRGRPGFSLIVALGTTPVAVGLYAWLIPDDGAAGAAIASSLAYAWGFALSVVIVRRMLARRVSAMILPGRSELQDYSDLLRSIYRRLAGARS